MAESQLQALGRGRVVEYAHASVDQSGEAATPGENDGCAEGERGNGRSGGEHLRKREDGDIMAVQVVLKI
jgi:hypothetical protein